MCEAQMCCGQIANKRKLLDEFKQLEDNLKDAEEDLNAAYLKIHELEEMVKVKNKMLDKSWDAICEAGYEDHSQELNTYINGSAW